MMEEGLKRLSNESMSPYKTRLISDQILSELSNLKVSNQTRSLTNFAPLIVGLQGPQGSGKTTITSSVKQVLSSSPHNLNVAIYSLDDLYLPHSSLESLKSNNSDNKLLHGRGQPGTHDLELGTEILKQLSTINEPTSEGDFKSLDLPIYDKSLFEGQGDRSLETISLKVPPFLNVVIFEGWCLGFQPLSEENLTKIYQDQKNKVSDSSASGEDKEIWKPYFLNHSLENLLEINRHLKEFKESWYPFLQSFVQLLPESEFKESKKEGEEDLDPFGCEKVLKWRWQAEEEMKRKNGGKGMNQEQVKKFVERYFPSYELFSSTLTNISNKKSEAENSDSETSLWKGKGLRIVLGSDREVKGVEKF